MTAVRPRDPGTGLSVQDRASLPPPIPVRASVGAVDDALGLASGQGLARRSPQTSSRASQRARARAATTPPPGGPWCSAPAET